MADGGIEYLDDVDEVDWAELKRDLAADSFDNGRSPEQLRLSFERSWAAVMAWDGVRVVGNARLLADGVCNAYLVDVWTASSHRRRGVGGAMVRRLLDRVPGHHVALFTEDRADFYETLGFRPERVGMSVVIGRWLDPG